MPCAALASHTLRRRPPVAPPPRPRLQVWAVPTTMMQCDWLGERVATVDVDRAIANVIHNKEDAGWGPNAVFRWVLLPRRGRCWVLGQVGGGGGSAGPWPQALPFCWFWMVGRRPAGARQRHPRLLPASTVLRCTPAACLYRPHLYRRRRFPLEGGTGGIWKGVAKLLPPERQRYNSRMTALDREAQVATFADGRKVGGCWATGAGAHVGMQRGGVLGWAGAGPGRLESPCGGRGRGALRCPSGSHRLVHTMNARPA